MPLLIAVGWAVCFYVSRACFLGDWRAKFGDYRSASAPTACLSLLGPGGAVGALIVAVVEGAKPDWNWMERISHNDALRPSDLELGGEIGPLPVSAPLMVQPARTGSAHAGANAFTKRGGGESCDGAATGLLPDIAVANTMGWRWWYWDPINERLTSPHIGTIWRDQELHCPAWSEQNVVRGTGGIHARLVPHNWETSETADVPRPHDWTAGLHGYYMSPRITGIVERFGRFVLGTEGWRAEWVIIRKLLAPSETLGLALEKAYPDVEVIYANR